MQSSHSTVPSSTVSSCEHFLLLSLSVMLFSLPSLAAAVLTPQTTRFTLTHPKSYLQICYIISCCSPASRIFVPTMTSRTAPKHNIILHKQRHHCLWLATSHPVVLKYFGCENEVFCGVPVHKLIIETKSIFQLHF